MQALVYTGPGELQVLDVERPAATDGEVVVDVAAAGICGSEVEGVANRSPFRIPPLIMGHEFAGHRADTREAVAVNPLIFCGRCDLCLRGRQNICRNRAILGIQRAGGFADSVAVPAANCVTLPTGATMVQGAFAEPLANGIHALRLIREHDPTPDRVGIIGVGPLGYAVLTAAVHSGVSRVDAADTFEPRRTWAQRAGACRCTERLDGEFDAIVDTVGTTATRAQSVELLRPGGTAIWMGLHGPDSNIDGQAMIRTEKRVLTSFCYTPDEFRRAVDMVTRLETDRLDPICVVGRVHRRLLRADRATGQNAENHPDADPLNWRNSFTDGPRCATPVDGTATYVRKFDCALNSSPICSYAEFPSKDVTAAYSRIRRVRWADFLRPDQDVNDAIGAKRGDDRAHQALRTQAN